MSDLTNPLIAEHIGPYYVYLLVDPESDEVFYVGKGTGWRFAAHLNDEVLGNDAVSDEEAGAKLARIRAIRARGQEPQVQFARIKIESEDAAFMVEAALIDVLGRYGPHAGMGLTNKIRGPRTENGLIGLAELAHQLTRPPLDTPHAAILIKLGWWGDEMDTELPRRGYGYRHGMSDQELYDSTRAWWPMSLERAKGYRYAVTIFQGVTRAVYQIDPARWRRQQQPAGSRRVAFEAARLREGEVFEAFMGMDSKGTCVPPTRPTGRAVFGTGGSIAYWPD